MPACYGLLKKAHSVNKHFIHCLLLCGILTSAPNSGVVFVPLLQGILSNEESLIKKNTSTVNDLSL